jgi:hypothetical protein
MVGAGELYFKRLKADGTYEQFHHLGNSSEFTITNEVTKIEKNSAMNDKRALMASVVTAVKPTASITLDEYDPYTLALGLYGTQGVKTQVSKAITDEVHTVETVPGIIQLVDINGDAYYNISAVTVAPSVPVVASIGVATKETALTSTGTVASSGTFTGTANKEYFVKVKTAPTASGDVGGMVVSTATSLVGPYTDQTVFGAGLTEALVLGDGVTITFTVTTGQTFAVGEIYSISAIAASSAYIVNTDYIVESQSSRAGMIKIPANSHIVAGSTVKVTATIPAGSYPKVSGGSAGEIEGHLLYIGQPNIGGKYNIEAWKCKVTPDGALSGLIGTDFGSYKLALAFEDDTQNHPDDPYYTAVEVG